MLTMRFASLFFMAWMVFAVVGALCDKQIIMGFDAGGAGVHEGDAELIQSIAQPFDVDKKEDTGWLETKLNKVLNYLTAPFHVIAAIANVMTFNFSYLSGSPEGNMIRLVLVMVFCVPTGLGFLIALKR